MSWRLALQDYIKNPQYYKDEVIFYDEKAIIMKDQFPKSTYHLLVLPRNPMITRQHPTTGLNSELKDKLQPYMTMAQDYIYEQFTQKYKLFKTGSFFEHEEDFLSKDRFVDSFIQVGIHSVPSMTNMHIHVLTKDFNAIGLKNKKHYNSFTTNFWVDWDLLPLSEIPDAKETERRYLRDEDLISPYNNKNFSNKFSMLKKHLLLEFDVTFTAR